MIRYLIFSLIFACLPLYAGQASIMRKHSKKTLVKSVVELLNSKNRQDSTKTKKNNAKKKKHRKKKKTHK